MFHNQRRRASTRTGNDGRFRLELAFGYYTIHATNGAGYRSTTTAEVDMHATPIAVELTVDSGIRYGVNRTALGQANAEPSICTAPSQAGCTGASVQMKT
jgi:hypothetical protein